MNTKITLRLLLAVSFAVIAIIFSELIPPVENLNSALLRVLLTILSALIGFLVFPDLASWATSITVSGFNFLVHRLTSEILSQLFRAPKDGFHIPFITPPTQTVSAIGGVSLQKPLILDTSAIIDGRILDIAKTGFLYGNVVIPAYVLTEIQQVSDSSDFLKRSRGRRGFEIVEELKKIKGIHVEIWDKDTAGKSVDSKVMQLAKNLHGRIVTTDFNLNKLASISNIAVLNVNDLANAVKTIAIPGQRMEIKIVHIGKDADQGVGYLPDGTMLVIKDGAELVGKTIAVEITKSLQVSAGRMIFAKKIIG